MTVNLPELAEGSAQQNQNLADLTNPAEAARNLGLESGIGQGEVNRVTASGASQTLPASFSAHHVTMDRDCEFAFGAPAKQLHAFTALIEGAYLPLFPQVSWRAGLQPAHFNPSEYSFRTVDGGQTYLGAQTWWGTPTPPPAPPATNEAFGFTENDGAPTTSFVADLTGAVAGETVIMMIAAATSAAITITPPGQSVPGLPGDGEYAASAQTPSPTTSDDMDDVALWVHPTSPSQSLVFGCRKSATGGGLYSYNLDGTVNQFLSIGKINNVDIREHAGTGRIILTASNRTTNTLDYFELNPATRQIAAVGSTAMGFEPYGCTMGDLSGSLFAYVTQNTPASGALRRYALTVPSSGSVTGALSGSTTTGTLTEGMAVDDAAGYLFLGEEDVGLYRYSAADVTASRTAVDTVGGGNLVADVEGVEVVPGREGDAGYILVSSQGDSSFHLYDLASPHTHRKRFTITDVNDCDGVVATRAALGSAFPDGLLVVHDSITSNPGSNLKFVDAGLVFGRYGTSSSEVVTLVPPSRDSVHSPTLNFSLYLYQVPATPPASLTFVMSQAVEGSLTWARYATGVIDPVTPLTGGAVSLSLFAANSDTITVPSITTDVPGAVLLAGACVGAGATEPAIGVQPGWTTQVTATDRTAVIATKGQQTIAGPTGTVSFGPLNAAAYWVGWQLALRPAGVAGDGGGTGSNPSTATVPLEFDRDWSATWPYEPSGVFRISGPGSGREGNFMDPARAAVANGVLTLTSNASVYEGAEIQSVFALLQPGPGKYEVRMQTSPTAGLCQSFYWVSNNFGPRRISIHALTKNPTKVVFEILWNGASHQYVHDLGFDASAAQHSYAFQWESGNRVVFSVNGVDVYTYTATSSIDLVSPDKGILLANTWTNANTAWAAGPPASNGTMTIDHIRYWASQVTPPEPPPPGTTGSKPLGFPSTTGIHYGVPVGTTLTPMTAREIGNETIEDKEITGVFEVNPGSGNTAIIRRCRIKGNGTANEGYAIRVRSGRLLIEDYEIVGIGGAKCADNALYGVVTARRGYITDFGRDGIKSSSGSIYEDNHIKMNPAVKVSGAHSDGLQFSSAQSDIIVRRNVFEMGNPTTSSVLLKYDIGSASYAPGPVLFEDNYFSGGGITFYTVMGNAGEYRNVTVKDNLWHGDATWYEVQRSSSMTNLLYTGTNTLVGGGALRIQEI